MRARKPCLNPFTPVQEKIRSVCKSNEQNADICNSEPWIGENLFGDHHGAGANPVKWESKDLRPGPWLEPIIKERSRGIPVRPKYLIEQRKNRITRIAKNPSVPPAGHKKKGGSVSEHEPQRCKSRAPEALP